MKQTEAGSEALGIWDTLTQMVGVLGFHDMTSFLVTCLFLIAFVAFMIGASVVIMKKRRERLLELQKIVEEVQAPLIKDALPKPPEAAPDLVPPKPVESKSVEKIAPVLEEPAPQIPVEPKKPVEPVAAKLVEQVKPVAKPAPVVAKKVGAKPAEKPKAEPAPQPIKTAEPLPEKVVAKAPVVEAKKPEPQREQPALEPVKPVVEVPAVPDGKAALGAALKNTRGGFMEKLARLFSRGQDVSDADFEEMEAILFTADIGAKTAQKLLDVMRDRARAEKSVSKDFLRTVLKEEMTKILESAKAEPAAATDAASPQVLMFVGVNGAGKTTSIGKLGAQLASSGKKVLFGAGDTFRAAAVEQLSVWGQRVGAEVVSGKENSDSAAVLFEAIEKAKNSHVDYVLCDTAGRLHTKTSLMDELKKVHRVVSKAQSGAPHQVFLVIDATMGQNALNQAREFAQATPLTGVVLSKLDGTAKGGVALGIVDELKVPIRYVGIGERVADLRDFDAKQFVDALFEEA